jgi:hypothetical protein
MWGNLLKPPSSGAFIPQDIEMIHKKYNLVLSPGDFGSSGKLAIWRKLAVVPITVDPGHSIRLWIAPPHRKNQGILEVQSTY